MALICLLPTRLAGSGPARPPSKALASPGSGWNALRARDAATPEQRGQRQRELEDVRRRLSDLYDECLQGLDAELGRFLRELAQEAAWQTPGSSSPPTTGNTFGEHDQFGHGSSLYNEQTHVPLVLIPPLGAEGTGTDSAAELRGQRVAVPVSLRELARTLTELLIGEHRQPLLRSQPRPLLERMWARPGRSRPLPTGGAEARRRRLYGRSVGQDPFRDR